MGEESVSGCDSRVGKNKGGRDVLGRSSIASRRGRFTGRISDGLSVLLGRLSYSTLFIRGATPAGLGDGGDARSGDVWC